MIEHRIAVSATTAEKQSEAQTLADTLNLPFISDPQGAEIFTYDFLLILTPDYLGLQKTTALKEAPFYIDFLSGKMLYRINQAGLRKELLARTMGFKPSEHPHIVDATAGLGRDSFILASLGFEVTLLERSPILCALLQDAFLRAEKKEQIAPVIKRLHLLKEDAFHWLKKNTDSPQVIYLDPMFPPRKKSASVKKEMVLLQELLGKDDDADKLFELALSCATVRVVVKRPRFAPNMARRLPNFSLVGKSSRFDVYLTQNVKMEF
jgi:16S rRNA (guanine1516-N2)-methyltransferase